MVFKLVKFEFSDQLEIFSECTLLDYNKVLLSVVSLVVLKVCLNSLASTLRGLLNEISFCSPVSLFMCDSRRFLMRVVIFAISQEQRRLR